MDPSENRILHEIEDTNSFHNTNAITIGTAYSFKATSPSDDSSPQNTMKVCLLLLAADCVAQSFTPKAHHFRTPMHLQDTTNSDDVVLEGQCYCGAVKLKATAMPDAKAFCHCTACRRFGGSLVFVTLFPPDKLEITGEMISNDPVREGFHMGYPPGKEVGMVKDTEDGKMKLYQPRGFSIRKTCAKCHANILNDHGDVVDVNGGMFNWGPEGFQTFRRSRRPIGISIIQK